LIHETEYRRPIDKEEAQKKILDFFSAQFGFNVDEYKIKTDSAQNYDNRSEYSFTWQKKDVDIPWSSEENSGTGKLLTGGIVAGDEVRYFSYNYFEIPDKFERYLAEKEVVSQNISTVVRVFHFLFFIGAVFYIVIRRNHLAMHMTKSFYIGITAISFIASLLTTANNYEMVLFGYATTSPFNSYLIRLIINTILSALLFTVAILMPSLAGESLHFEVFRHRKEGGFLHYVNSTFFSRNVTKLVLIGYLLCVIMLGIQSLLTKIGQQYWGVWVEHTMMGQLSTSYLPFLAAFAIGYKASFSEEFMYRLFAISWGKKILKSTLFAALIASMVWGFAHSNYPVYPMWFRGVEVTCLGLLLSFIYLRFGIIPVIVAHYLFDVFWSTSGYLLGKSIAFDYYSAIFVLAIPLIYAVIAFFLNRVEIEGKLEWRLNKHQLYNLQVLREYLHAHPELFKNKTKRELKDEIILHGWDVAVVEIAFKEMV